MNSFSPQRETTFRGDVQSAVTVVAWRTLVAIGAVALIALISFGIGTGRLHLLHLFSAIAVMGSLVLPWHWSSLSFVILCFAGRFEVPPFAESFYDVAFWSLLGLGLAALSCREPSNISRVSTIGICLFMLILWTVITMVSTIEFSYAREKSFRVLVFAVGFFLLSQVFLAKQSQVVSFMVTFVIFVNGLAIASVVIALQSAGLEGLQRISLPGGGPITLARLIGFAVLTCLSLSYFHSKRVIFLLNAAALTVLVFATGSRGPSLFLLLLIVSLPFLASLSKRNRRQSMVLMLSIFMAALSAIPLIQFSVDRNLPFLARFALLLDDDKGFSYDLRRDFLTTGLALAEQGDYLGFGVGSWPILTGQGDIQAYPHNIFVETLVEQGVLGIVLFVAFLSSVVFTALKALRRCKDGTASALVAGSLACFLYALTVAQTSGDLYDNRYLWLYAGLVATTSKMGRARASEIGGEQLDS